MKWQLLATVIEDPGFTARVSHVHLSVERDRLRCTCRQTPPAVYVSSNIEPPDFKLACHHVRMLYDRTLAFNATINFTVTGREEFDWRRTVKKLVESA